MQITIQLHAVLRERAGAEHLTLDGVPDDLTVAGAKRLVAERWPELGNLDHVRGVLGTRYVPDGQAVDGSEVLHLLPPVSGGEPGEDELLERGLFELSSEPLDPGACLARVTHESCGASVVFTGTTRNRNRGQDVDRLEYEAFAAMAGPEMERVFEDCRALFGEGGSEEPAYDSPEGRSLRMLCVHRTGAVGLGEPSVVVAVASPHRDAAFRACRFLIDELKARLPVWKKEHYGDGHHWIGDRS
ncbi:molybdenum cofactor biosynthesis protein [Engelhardtia mirabilis]|uniref:Molybdopterin synthase catalytic subunit n=1 Tax=Engelhardtia mirabilis TaxID=2528011 RepID=A0A518BLU2_9BACT|nr:Molybdopterin synthase catalytic subunit 1 [Planctomycetes bacterium Pla133]QDV02271.1 Molybdopterin synthase catalytic subunit 1 [Planctomycetes bacterium Pla86]